MAEEGFLLGKKAIEQVRELIREMHGQLKNPGGAGKRGSISIGLSSYVVKLKSSISARSVATLGSGTVYLQEADGGGAITDTTLTKTIYNVGGRNITLSTSTDTYVLVEQTNWGAYVVIDPPKATACNFMDGLSSTEISGFSASGTQFLSHGSTGCFSWVTGSTCT